MADTCHHCRLSGTADNPLQFRFHPEPIDCVVALEDRIAELEAELYSAGEKIGRIRRFADRMGRSTFEWAEGVNIEILAALKDDTPEEGGA